MSNKKLKYFWKLRGHLILFVNFTLLFGCGYQFEDRAPFSERPYFLKTISVPFAEGDFDGNFTVELIQELASSPNYSYERVEGEFLLKIRLVDFHEDNIGFRYYRNKHEKLTSETIPVETRLSLTAVVSLLDSRSLKVLQGPVRITATTDFDHDFYSTKDAINVFSLGQLTDYDEASDAARRPLFQHLAKKIVDYLSDSW